MSKRTNKEKLCVKIVPETHWDRTWYLPFEEFRISLVDLMDHVLETVRKDREFTTFCLDGQTVVVEDYLEIKPNQRKALQRAVEKGRVKVGPWYILPDEFLVSPEALIRNLLTGREISQSLGKTMNVGYVPDPFGHIGQLPQILNGFGIDSFIFSRGIIHEEWKNGLEFNWRAPDGSEVLGLWQRDFYNNAAFLGYHLVWGNAERHIFNSERAQEQLQKAVEDLVGETRCRTVLLNNGVDHSDIQTELPEIVREARKRHPDWEVSIAGFDDYVQAVKKGLSGKKLKRHTGEITYPYGDLLIGVYSSRMYLKQANHQCQLLLERYSEPLSALARTAGHERDARPFLNYAWRRLLQNHPHDDICGCSVDAVHRDMEIRFAAAEQIGWNLATEGLRRLAHRLDHSGQDGIPHVIYNPTGHARQGPQRLRFSFNVHEKDRAKTFRLVDTEGNIVPYEEVKREDVRWMECCKGFVFESVEVLADVDSVPACGLTTLYAQPGKRSKKPARRVKVTARGLENEFLRVKVNANGTYNLTDKASDVTYRGLGLFEDCEDVGDAYNWSHAKKGKRLTTRSAKAEIRVLERKALCGALEISVPFAIPQCIHANRESRSEETVELRLVTRLELSAGRKRLEIETRFGNLAKDHRLRVLFPTDLTPDAVQVDGHFDVVERSVHPPPKRKWAGKWMKPTMSHNQKTFVDLSDGRRGLAVLNCGLPEYEVLPGKRGHTLALTLMRSVGWVSRGDFATRPGNAGPSVEAQEAQCLRPFSFQYAVVPHDGSWLAGGVAQEGQEFNTPLQITRADLHAGTVFEDVPGDIFEVPDEVYLSPIPREGDLPPSFSFVDLKPQPLILSACKTAQDRDEIVVRFYNPSGRAVRGRVTFGLPIKRVRLLRMDETPIRKTAATGPVSWTDRRKAITVPAHGVMTLGVQVK